MLTQAAVLLTLLCGAWGSNRTHPTTHWWQVASFYQVYPRSFKDSNGDGIGDLKGIASMASYFKEIGVDAIWMNPIMMSPMKDFGYDISNYTEIDPIFGNFSDFHTLITALNAENVKVVVDFVPNHCSDQHPWFQASVKRQDPYTDYFIWTDGNITANGTHIPPNNWLSVFSGSAWHWNDERQQFYFHDFLTAQPDLNFRNPKVVTAMEDVIRFWLDLGVDGFRVDSANYLFEVEDLSLNEPVVPGTNGTEWNELEHIYTQNQPETYALTQQWAQIFYNYSIRPNGKPRALFLEVYTDLNHTIQYYGKGNNSLMQPFNFQLLIHGNQSTRAPRIKELIDTWIDQMPTDDVPNWTIGNHDNGRIADRYGPAMVDALNLLTGVLPGIKVTYNGEEIGMQDTFIRWDQTVDSEGLILGPYKYQTASRDPERTPFQWDASLAAGFSTNSTPWLPVNPNYWWLNVDAQRKAPVSHLKVFQAMSKARKDNVLIHGNLDVQAPDNDTLIVIRSVNSSHYVLVINTGSEIRNYTSQNLFGANNVDVDMHVVTGSCSFDQYPVGTLLKGKSLQVTLRPRSSVLLATPSTVAPSAAAALLTSLPLLLAALISTLWR